MTEKEYIEILEEAEEYGKRFPDLSNWEICDAISDITQRNIPENSILGRSVIYAFDYGVETAKSAFRYDFWIR